MSSWMWDVLGGMLALLILVVTVVDILIAVVMVNVLNRWWHEHKANSPGTLIERRPPADAGRELRDQSPDRRSERDHAGLPV
jgi:hypothetical protein